MSTDEKAFEAGLLPARTGLRSDPSRDLAARVLDRHFRQDEAKLDQWDEFESQVLQRFHQYRVPIIELLQSTPKEAVCQVFEKVNTGGVALTVFELMTATYATDNFELRERLGRRAVRLIVTGSSRKSTPTISSCADAPG